MKGKSNYRKNANNLSVYTDEHRERGERRKADAVAPRCIDLRLTPLFLSCKLNNQPVSPNIFSVGSHGEGLTVVALADNNIDKLP